jgi:hypothetical protein
MIFNVVHKEDLYPAPKPHRLELISKHLKPINYDRWAELYRKKQLESLGAAEEKELDALEKDNLKTVEKVYSALSSDKKVQAQIEMIKSHPWVKLVEG